MRSARFIFMTLLMAAMILATRPAAAQHNELGLGDAAPGLDIEAWVKGGEVVIEPERVYVFVFFNTTEAITDRLMQVYSKMYLNNAGEGLVVVGISDEDLEVVEDYVRRKGAQIAFPIGVDNRGATRRNWVGAAKVEKTPAVFIVDKRGLIQYIGEPTDKKLPDILELIATKRYDARLYEQAQPVLKAIQTARSQRNWRLCMKYVDDLIKTDKYAFAPMVLEKFEMILVDMKDTEAAYAYGREVLVEFADDPVLLSWLAKKVATDPNIPNEQRNLDFAQEAVDAAWPKLSQDDPDNFALAAIVRFHRGEYAQAVQLQRKAYFVSSTNRKSHFQNVLKTYMEAAKRGGPPPVVPAAADPATAGTDEGDGSMNP